MFERHVRRIEDPDFQIQFAALSGYSVLQLVLARHEFVRSLVASVASGEVELEDVYERIIYLLPRIGHEADKSYDGSIVVYLHCLALFDMNLAHEASEQIRDTAGLFWSRRMALRLLEAAEAEAIPSGE